jgi:hypothetical protein
MGIVSRRGKTAPAKVVWTLTYWLVSALPVLIFLGFLYNVAGERTAFEHLVRHHVQNVVKHMGPTPSPTPSASTHR